ncbi:uncharacterized protein LOC117113116 [Anneissia japonica]|uniref:uncharacterized protein LOC117113116 n=1 Tax=Anneissia japonica TaxID=1529436 RepID=UPI001425820B|nr:uncharacterized protein LOC117113116 [Anneissia japonica]
MCIRPRKCEKLAVGTLNVRGIRSHLKQKDLALDLERYNVQILGVQETHLQGTGVIDLPCSGNLKYVLFYTGSDNNSHHGVGIAIEKGLCAKFKGFSDRTCMATFRIDEKANKPSGHFGFWRPSGILTLCGP